MKHIMTWRLFFFSVSLLTVVFFFLAQNREDVPPEHIILETPVLATLLPHAHTHADKVSDTNHGIVIFSEPIEVSETMWVTDIRLSVENAPQSVIHHLHIEIVKPEFEQVPSRGSILNAGQDTAELFHFPEPTGIRLQAGTRIQIEVMLHNPTPPLGEGDVYHDVVVHAELSGVPDHTERWVPIIFDFLKLTDATDELEPTTFTVPANTKHYVRTYENNPQNSLATHEFAHDGWIIHMGAHFHAWEGGTNVTAYLNGKPIHSYASFLKKPDIPWSWRTNIGPFYKRVHQGDVLTFSATYENEGNEPIVGAMGMLGVYYVEDSFVLNPALFKISWYAKSFLYPVLDALHIQLDS